MAVFERNLRVRAPFDDVWAFHSTIDGLRSLTPNWLNIRIEKIEHPNNGRDAHVLTEGTRIHASVTPFGFGPRQSWVSVIEERAEFASTAHFVDSMDDGPFPEWEHTHSFYEAGDETLIRDRVEFRTTAGGVGNRFAVLGLAPMFYYRHRRTRDILE